MATKKKNKTTKKKPSKALNKKKAARPPARKAPSAVPPKARASVDAPAPRVKKLEPLLSKKELQAVRVILLAKREDLLRNMQRAELETKQLEQSAEVKDSADLATDAYEIEFSSELSDTERRSLTEIELALERIKTGEYGRCVTCGKKIPKIRLAAMPSARLCIDCQTQREQNRPR